MSVLPPFRLLRPRSVSEALGLVDYDRMAYAGGTELLLAMKEGLLRPTHLVDLKGIPGLDRVVESGDEVSIGALVTHTRAADDPVLRSRLPGLAGVLTRVGNPRVRATGTLAGNLCFAEPRSDVAPALIAMGAEVEISSRDGHRRMAVGDLILGPYTTALQPGQLLTRIIVPVRPGLRFVYLKHQTAERPALGVALAVDSHVSLVVGAVGLTPQVFCPDSLSEIDAHEIAGRVEVIPDMTGSEEYKRHLVEVYLRRALTEMGGES